MITKDKGENALILLTSLKQFLMENTGISLENLYVDIGA